MEFEDKFGMYTRYTVMSEGVVACYRNFNFT